MFVFSIVAEFKFERGGRKLRKIKIIIWPKLMMALCPSWFLVFFVIHWSTKNTKNTTVFKQKTPELTSNKKNP